ncbi:hypothetical protein EYF80_041339 [Liparis tanakae]|uniref:Uncharacterized protein n=1 Tax=Liparis tanakae TaxID=230148 RepID=A0A4Z2G5W8_9TELE|nr:hypothetical protein EYF80_041339 [Liparis tanakae]
MNQLRTTLTILGIFSGRRVPGPSGSAGRVLHSAPLRREGSTQPQNARHSIHIHCYVFKVPDAGVPVSLTGVMDRRLRQTQTAALKFSGEPTSKLLSASDALHLDLFSSLPVKTDELNYRGNLL